MSANATECELVGRGGQRRQQEALWLDDGEALWLDDGDWRAVVLGSSDRRAYLESAYLESLFRWTV